MSYSVNWISKVISIPSSDLELVSGTRYRLVMSDFLSEIRRLESEPSQGLWAEQILSHTNAQTLAGVTFAPSDEVVNGYTIQFTGVATRVDLAGSNNNLIDVLIATGVSVVPSNSAGLQLVATNGNAYSLSEIGEAVWANMTAQSLVERQILATKILRNKMVTDPVSGEQVIYDDDGITVLLRGDLYEGTGTGQKYRGQGAERRERLE